MSPKFLIAAPNFHRVRHSFAPILLGQHGSHGFQVSDDRLSHASFRDDGVMAHGLDVLADKQCGACTACCTHLPIPAGLVSAIAKPAGVPCPKLCGDACAVYADRPQMCRDFRCAWHSDPAWPLTWRPEQSGILCLREELPGELHGAVAYELRLDALQSPVGEALIAALAAMTKLLVVVDARGRRQTLQGASAAAAS